MIVKEIVSEHFSKPKRQAIYKLNNVRNIKEIEQEMADGEDELSCKNQENFEVESAVKKDNMGALQNEKTKQQNMFNEKQEFFATFELNITEKKDCGVQTLQIQKSHYRSKSTSCCSKTKNVACSPIKKFSKQTLNNNNIS